MEILKTYFLATKKVEQEFQQTELSLEGKLPEDILGTLFRNGNGRFEHQGILYDHLFDGDGMITKFEFSNGKIHYSNRYVRTKEFVEEEKAGKMLYRSFGTNIPGGRRKNFLKMRFKNAANTSIIWHGQKMLALWEGGLPHQVDPVTLATIERHDYDGTLINKFSFADQFITPELPFSAHPKIHQESGVLHNFGTVAGTKQRLVLYEVSPNGQAQISKSIEMDEVTFTHDFVLTQKQTKVFFLTPVAFDLYKAFSGLVSPAASIKTDPSKQTKILIVDANNEVKSLESEFCFVFHYANGYETPEGQIVVDGYIMTEFPSAEVIKDFVNGIARTGPVPMLTRFIIDPDKGSIHKQPLSSHPGELPFVRPDKEGIHYQYCWNIAGTETTNTAVFTGLAKVNTQTRETLYREFHPNLPGEPVFVPKKNSKAEDDGYLLVLLFDSNSVQTKLHILDAASLETIASATLPHNIPLGFHGFWTDKIYS